MPLESGCLPERKNINRLTIVDREALQSGFRVNFLF